MRARAQANRAYSGGSGLRCRGRCRVYFGREGRGVSVSGFQFRPKANSGQVCSFSGENPKPKPWFRVRM